MKYFLKTLPCLAFLFLYSISFSAFGGSIYENSLKNYIKDDLKKFLFKKDPSGVEQLITLDKENNLLEINTKRKVLVINFWATWCAPCKKEMPSLNRLAKQFDKSQLEIITIASGRNSIKNINKFFIENDIDELTRYRDPSGKTAISYGVIGLPTTIIVSPNGEEIGRILGDVNWDQEEFYKFFSKLINILTR